MTLDFDPDIRRELNTARTLAEDTVADLAARCDRLAADGGVDAHPVAFRVEHWHDLLHVLPAEARRDGRVTRGQVRAVVKAAIARSSPLDLLAAVYIWGHGRNGYARTRYDRIIDGREAEVAAKLTTATKTLRDSGPVDAYAQLWGGEGRSGGQRASAGNPDWSRIDGLGPAFFTKILYFGDRRALVLDQVLARRVAALSGLPNFVGTRGRAPAWHPYRYAVYLEWMSRTAHAIDQHAQSQVTPDLLELALFRPRGRGDDESGAAS